MSLTGINAIDQYETEEEIPESFHGAALIQCVGTNELWLSNGVTTERVGSHLSGSTTISVTDNTNAALRITQLGTGNALVVEDSTNPDSTPFVINASGNVGIGTSSPGRSLDVSAATGLVGVTSSTGTNYVAYQALNTGGTMTLGLEGSSPVVFSGATAYSAIFGTGGAYSLHLATNNTVRQTINSSGIVTMAAYGAGAATFSAAGVISSVSDETWKIKDGVPVNPDEMLQKLKPGYWFYNEEKAPIFGTDRQLGFYAQNVNEAIGPEAAPPPEEGKPWGYYDRSVLAVTVMSLQKALATIEALTARLTALEAK